jgi:hypothetical protein
MSEVMREVSDELSLAELAAGEPVRPVLVEPVPVPAGAPDRMPSLVPKASAMDVVAA